MRELTSKESQLDLNKGKMKMLTPAQTCRWSYLAENNTSAAEEPAAKQRLRQHCCLPGSGERLRRAAPFAENISGQEPGDGQAAPHTPAALVLQLRRSGRMTRSEKLDLPERDALASRLGTDGNIRKNNRKNNEK